jgi:ubiquinone/menaquinone biosynthesis C-methylase UbiE
MNAVTLYNDIWSSTSELEAQYKESLSPRSSDMLYDLFASFAPSPQSKIIDIGCRDAKDAIALAHCFECQVLGIDPVPIHIERARKKIDESGLADQVSVTLTGIEAIPVADGSFDFLLLGSLNRYHDDK